MAGGTRIPSQRMSIFRARAHLEKNLPGGVENEDVDCPVEQVIRMHFAPGGRPLESIFFVHHWELLFGRMINDLGEDGSNPIGERDPLLERELFSARARIQA